MGNKRRRVALSCVDCRRRKVKCDRTYPQCIRCQKGGYGDQCTYVTHTSDPQPAALPTPEDEELQRRRRRALSWAEEATDWEATARSTAAAKTQMASQTPASQAPSVPPSIKQADKRLSQLQGRLHELENRVYTTAPRSVLHEQSSHPRSPGGRGAERSLPAIGEKYVLSESDKVLLRGQSFKTKYFGPSHILSILLQFEDLSKFVKDMLVAMPSLSDAKITMSKVRTASKKGEKIAYDLAIGNLSPMVPERSFADRLLSQYLEVFETTYRILHVPSFLEEYEAFWRAQNQASPGFVVKLLLIMATVYCVVPGGKEGYLGRSSVRRETANHWVNVCQHWLDKHSQKHIDMTYFQVHVLIWLARKMNCLKIKREWTAIGHVCRLMMISGFHREPNMVSKRIGAFDSEMRRRLWYTVLELDLQTALNRGMAPTVSPFDWDTLPPSNIDDESFGPDSNGLPESKDREQFTRTTFLALQAESLPLRLETLQKVNSIRAQMDLDMIMAFDNDFRTIIDELPVDEWKDADATHHNTTSPTTASSSARTPALFSTSPSPAFAAALCRLIFSEYIAVLHQHAATLTPLKQKYFFSRAARREESLHCLSICNRSLEEKQWRICMQFREDNVRAVLAICHDLSTASPHLQGTNDTAAVELLQDTVHKLGDVVRSLGQGFHGYWIISSALSFVHSKQSPQVPTSTFAQAAIDRIIRLHDAVMKGQIPQARQLMPADTNFDGFHASQRQQQQQQQQQSASNVGGLGNDLPTGASGATASTGAVNMIGTDQAMANMPQTTTTQLELDTGMDLMGGGYDQVDVFGNEMFGSIDDLDWSNIWSIDPFGSWPMVGTGATLGGGSGVTVPIAGSDVTPSATTSANVNVDGYFTTGTTGGSIG